MSQHKATIQWTNTGPNFAKGQYSREHTWSFDGGVTVLASSSPSVVPLPYSNMAGVDPEEAYVASISSCHMLTYLHVARLAGFQIDSYDDDSFGEMTKNDEGILWVSAVRLSPRIVYSGTKTPAPLEEEQMHHEAHRQCFIANSIRTEVIVEGAWHPVQATH